MSLTRRLFVRSATLSVLAGAAMPAVRALPLNSDDDDAGDNSAVFSPGMLAVFEHLVGEKFAISRSGRRLGRLTLISAQAFQTPAPARNNVRMVGQVPTAKSRSLVGFNLRFQGSGGLLPQDTYLLEHASLGNFRLLLVPAAPEATPHTYTAVFNFLGKAA